MKKIIEILINWWRGLSAREVAEVEVAAMSSGEPFGDLVVERNLGRFACPDDGVWPIKIPDPDVELHHGAHGGHRGCVSGKDIVSGKQSGPRGTQSRQSPRGDGHGTTLSSYMRDWISDVNCPWAGLIPERL